MALMSSFDSKVNRNFRTSSVLLEIKKSHLVNPVHGDGKDVLYITDLDTDVSPLQHPLYDPDADVVYVDMRGYSDMSRTGEFNVKPNMDSELQLLRAKLELCWMRCTSNELYSAFGYANEIYVRWFTTHISSMKSLTPAQDTKLRALVALFNIGQYYNNITEPALITRYYRLISQTFYIPMEDVEQVASSITQTFPRDLSEFVEAVREANISTRLNDLNEVTILNTLSRAWFFTANPGPVIGLAVEYPPAFCALVSMATKYRLFKKTGIGAIVEQNTRRDAHNNHVRAINILIDQKVGEPHPGKYRDYGMEQYPINAMAIPDFNVYEVGAESDVFARVLAGAAAGTLAGLLTIGIIKFIGWVTGSGSAGGGGSGGSSSSNKAKELENIRQETREIIAKSNAALVKAATYKMPDAPSVSINKMIEDVLANTKKLNEQTDQLKKENEEKSDSEAAHAPRPSNMTSFAVHHDATELLNKHFHGEDLIAALALLDVCKPSDQDDGVAIAKMLIEIDSKTPLFKSKCYVFAGLLATGKLTLPMLLTFAAMEDAGYERLVQAFNCFEEGWNITLSSIEQIIKAADHENEQAIREFKEINASFEEELESIRSEVAKMDEKGLDISADDFKLIDAEDRKLMLNEQALAAIRSIKDADAMDHVDPRITALEGRYVELVKSRTDKVKKLTEVYDKISIDNADLKIEVGHTRTLINAILMNMSKIFKPIRKASNLAGIHLHTFLSLAAKFDHAVEKINKTFEKQSKE